MALIDKLSAIGDAIREKTGKEDLLTLDEMPAEISAIETGGGELPEEAFNITGNTNYRFAYNHWNWFIEQYGNKIKTNILNDGNSMFYQSSNLIEVPFDLNIRLSSTTEKTILDETYNNCLNIVKYPNVYITGMSPTSNYNVVIASGINETQNIFWDENITVKGLSYDTMQKYKGKTEPSWLFNKLDWEVIRKDTSTFGTKFPVSWTNSYSIKEIPSFPNFYSNGTSNYYSHWYQISIVQCYSLQHITLPRPGECAYTSTPGSFNSMNGTASLKHLKFDVQGDGSPYTAKWKNTTFNLSTNVGYNNTALTTLSKYLPIEKLVNNEETYQLLKNDNEYWTNEVKYSCYNHDSAAETINSLPDTSAYGTNTIKFKGSSGSATDGGAINTLTEEEIAVATAKGWTVSFA